MNELTTERTSTSRASLLWFAAVIVFLLLLVLLLYTLVHEGGHALVGLLFGAKINAFSVNFLNLSAHVGIDGVFSRLQEGLVDAAGVSLPVLLSMIFLVLAQARSDHVLRWFKLILSMATINSVLAWIVIPILVMRGQTVADDSFNFLKITGIPPLLVTGAALSVYLACWFLFVRTMGGWRAVMDLFRTPALDLKQPDAQSTLRSLAGLAVVTASVTAALTLALPDRGFQPPADYQQAVEIELSQAGLQDQPVHRFRLEQSALVSIFIGLDQVRGGPMQIRLTGPNGYDNVFFNMPDPRAEVSKGSVHPQRVPLEKGEYEIRATFPRSQGKLRFYIKIG